MQRFRCQGLQVSYLFVSAGTPPFTCAAFINRFMRLIGGHHAVREGCLHGTRNGGCVVTVVHQNKVEEGSKMWFFVLHTAVRFEAPRILTRRVPIV